MISVSWSARVSAHCPFFASEYPQRKYWEVCWEPFFPFPHGARGGSSFLDVGLRTQQERQQWQKKKEEIDPVGRWLMKMKKETDDTEMKSRNEKEMES